MPRTKRLASAGRKFAAHPELKTPATDLQLQWVELGKLVLTSGSLVACDPLVSPEREAFPITVPPGTYPVWLAVDSQYHDPTCVLLRLQDSDPVCWEEALLPTQDPAKLEPGEHWGYGVDSGIGSFMDATVGRMVDERPAAGRAILADVLKRNKISYANIVLDEATGANVIAFSTRGDGVFSTFFGYDATGNIVSIITDIAHFADAINTTGQDATAS